MIMRTKMKALADSAPCPWHFAYSGGDEVTKDFDSRCRDWRDRGPGFGRLLGGGELYRRSKDRNEVVSRAESSDAVIGSITEDSDAVPVL